MNRKKSDKQGLLGECLAYLDFSIVAFGCLFKDGEDGTDLSLYTKFCRIRIEYRL